MIVELAAVTAGIALAIIAGTSGMLALLTQALVPEPLRP